ncbi:MAG: DUF2237 family protein, partial [Hormoscilla sp. SP12CHS1]|nr:DUF2237 family protein [Hormoscilla sp. SP12CHS1]
AGCGESRKSGSEWEGWEVIPSSTPNTPVPGYNFPGLKPGDRWCLCASRWQEALDAGVAPPVVLSATHAAALEHVSLKDLKKHAIDD